MGVMSSTRKDRRTRRRKLLGAGVRTVGRGVLRTVPGGDYVRSWQKTGEDWYDTLGNLRGAAMKLGQIASQYHDVLPSAITEQLARLQRDAEPWRFEDIEPVLAERLDPEQYARIQHIEPTALAAASIGQVHAATLDSGDEIVIKIRYPGIADAVDADIANLGRLLKWSRLLPARAGDIDAILTELRQRFGEETDYDLERANLAHLRTMELPGQVLPEPIPGMCADGVLSMTRVDAAAFTEADPDAAEILVEGVCRQVFTHGALHADPHPGNFGIRDNGEVAIYDFGCVKYLTLDTRLAMRDIVAAGLDQDWESVHAALEKLGGVPPNRWATDGAVYAELYQNFADIVLEALEAEPVYTFSDDGLIQRLRAELRASLTYWHYFNAVPETIFVLRTLSGLYWLLRQIEGQAPVLELLERIANNEFGPFDADESSTDQS